MPLPKSLLEGHFRFRRDVHARDRGRYLQLAELGQAPSAMVIACCDARVDVAAIFDAEPGALFILRNVANLVPPYEPEGKYHGTSAAVEYAAVVLKVPHIVVLGHSHCGGVNTYRQRVRDNVPEQGFIGSWLTLLDHLKVVESDIFAYGDEMAFEFAALALKVPHIIVLGHSHCGGVDAYRRGVRDKMPERGFIGSWLTLLDNLKVAETDIFAYGDELAFEFAAIR